MDWEGTDPDTETADEEEDDVNNYKYIYYVD